MQDAIQSLVGSPGRRYLLQSGFIFALNLGATALLHEALGIPAGMAYAATLFLVTIVGFLTLKFFVYRDREGDLLRQFLTYLPSVALFRGAEYLGFTLLHGWLDLFYLAAIVIVQGTSFSTKYFYFRLLVFTKTSPRAD